MMYFYYSTIMQLVNLIGIITRHEDFEDVFYIYCIFKKLNDVNDQIEI